MRRARPGSAGRRGSGARSRIAVTCGVLGERVVDLAVAGHDLPLAASPRSSSGVVGRACSSRATSSAQRVGDDEVRAVLLERLDRAGRARARPGASSSLTSLPVRSGFCSEPDSANSFSMIFWVSTNHE